MALDLKTRVPRSPFDQLGGFAWLPRLIDKARATFAGTHGDYTPYPCPGDRQFLWYFGLDATAVGEVIRSGAGDDEILAFVQRSTKRTEEDKVRFLRTFHQPPRNPVMRFLLGILIRRGLKSALRARPGATPSGIDTLSKLLAFEEGHPIPDAP